MPRYLVLPTYHTCADHQIRHLLDLLASTNELTVEKAVQQAKANYERLK